MPSSLLFAALAVAWLVVLVPMFARRRQEVSRTEDSALAARVVRRGTDRHPGRGAGPIDQVEDGMPDTDRDDAVEEYDQDGGWRPVNGDDVRAGRRYRPGRGGFDPEAAALAARAKYARRQRIVLSILLAAVVTAVLAAVAWSPLWWLHALADLVLVGYLTYLRRQVRIEEEVRNRRLARMNGEREDFADAPEQDRYEYAEYDEDGYEYEDDRDGEFAGPQEADRRVPQRAERPAAVGRAVPVDIDDEDPMFDELDERTWQPYRKAVGE
ncbi:hypothetical protein IQ251_05635 [Saccharopolyspora sp. HNM0983]|uniref:Uncharacterized protein n=1 Tax=Saccharopolyspora montiporae TaxID=2781240 RepID=A0A929FWU2_9PSEU|nr:gephyrin-like molybdotransferase receptor GlpR [Saccharopolyspora sp. HNM0983]MBE9373926.1 hypothetical protein [Saccharopolyspora sp. HNM0983]